MKFSNKFVCESYEYSTYAKNVPAPIFRKSFDLAAAAETAEITICGLGFYDLFINGKKITKGYLAPYISNTDHYVYYDSYDIREYLKAGENVIGVMLGDGHLVGKTNIWDFKDNTINSAPMLALCVDITAGEEQLSFEADSFLCKKGPALFNDLRSGVFYDARIEDGWTRPGFEEREWHAPLYSLNKPRGAAKLCEAEPITVYREIKPISIKKGGLVKYKSPAENAEEFFKSFTAFEGPAEIDGGYIYDFGENNAGIVRLKIKGKRGQKVSLQFGEQLVDGKLNYNNVYFYPDGFAQRDIYYLKGEDEEIFEPMFTYHGFRYVYVSGITEEQATAELLTYLVMSSEVEERGGFECSDESSNLIYQMGRRSDISNFYYFPTDCPHREKNGWTADAASSAEHMIMTIGVENSWREWLHNICAAQKETGELPGIVPTGEWGYEWGNGPGWDRVVFDLPYFAYKYRGDVEIIKENAHAMLRYLEYVSRKRDEKGLVALGLPDWVPVVRCDGGKQSDAELGFTDSVMVLDMCRKGAEMFERVGLTAHKSFAETLGEEMLGAIRAEYIDFDTYIVRSNCQTAQAMAIFYDVFTEEEKLKAFEVLLDIVHEDHDAVTSGFMGMRVIFHVLSQFGAEELAYKMITRKEYPGYGYWLEKGATTFSEQFIKYDDFYPYSQNHHFMGDVVNWYMRYPGGINVESADEMTIKPYFLKEMNWCRAYHKLAQGSAEVYWEREGDEVNLRVTICGDIKCNVQMPEGTRCKVAIDRK